MFRTLRAFAWLRWRMLMNSFEKTGSRDMLERFSIATEKLGPILAMVIMLPTALMLAAGAFAAGLAVARGNELSLLFVGLRYLLVFVPIAAILGPVFLPSGDRTNPIRLLLLPIGRHTLYAAQASTTLGEPWLILMLPIFIGLPLGFLAGGDVTAASIAVVAGALLLLVAVGLSALTTSVLHLIVRDRRRAELFGVFFVIVISVAGLVPSLLQRPKDRTAEGRRPKKEVVLPAWAGTAGRRMIAVYPTELYHAAARDGAAGRLAGSSSAIVALAATAFLLHGIGFFAFGRVLDMPATSGAKRSGAERAVWGRTLPGLSAGASAVALTHLRLLLRTTRGRTTLISPLIMLVVFSALAIKERGGMDFGSFRVDSSLGLAIFISFISLVSGLPITMNQFAVDRAGLTMVFLSPLPERDYLAGKAVGNALISVPTAWFCALAVYLMFPGGSLALWLCVPIGLLATYLIVTPAAATFSAIFPKLVDLSSIGGRGNAHGLAGLLGMLSFVAGALPCVLIVLIASKLLDRDWLAPLLLLLWCGIAFLLSRALFGPVERLFAARRENLATLVSRLLSPS